MSGVLWTDVVKRVGMAVAAVALAMVSVETAAYATVSTVPEIDGGSLSAGLGLLGAGVLWLRARRASK